MHWKKYFDPGDYLFAADLQDDSGGSIKATVTIASVEQGRLPVKGTSRSEKKPVLTFVGRKKKFACNKTNCSTIAALYGNRTEDWVGKRITLFATTCNGISGGIVDCLRVFPAIPSAKTAEAPPEKQEAAPTAADEDDGSQS